MFNYSGASLNATLVSEKLYLRCLQMVSAEIKIKSSPSFWNFQSYFWNCVCSYDTLS